ncbi:putative uncharacterized transposon-derived protein F54H12.3 [Stylophora pistillata]|uniref:Uncharacterized transposon-derived protein F54H12.3 n=1 Tax=Stylophora pistillata TaxID=50429 RepID=A0A2B4RZ90_STYPI|nr:putative uncharacterized transposon-derived protein F54H12.3 [Stylophora pistillata]
MQKFAKWNKGYRYLLMVLDVFSKYGWIVPLKNKKGESVAEGFEKIFTEGRVPKRLWVDKGTEYYNSHVKDLMKSKGVVMYSIENEEKSSVCERWNRTIKTDMWKQFTIQNNTQYLDILPRIVEKYNNRKHRSIGMTPTEASKKKNENAVFLKLYSKELALWIAPTRGKPLVIPLKPKFVVGDHVRISKFKRKVLDKGFTPNWTEEIFVVDEVQYSNPITYKLKDLLGEEIKGSFYEQEMLRAKQDVFRIEKVIRKSKGKALVKWSGYPEKFNSWIDEKDLQGNMGLKRFYNLKKAQLIELIKNPPKIDLVSTSKINDPDLDDLDLDDLDSLSRPALLERAKEIGLAGRYILKKKELVEYIRNPPNKKERVAKRKVILKPVRAANPSSSPAGLQEELADESDEGAELVFPSMYAAAKHFNINPGKFGVKILGKKEEMKKTIDIDGVKYIIRFE